ncbi:WD40-repeat-containing domain protein [Jimgerdemannia flammicorona]|uniref:WD40-repeat-containing domain protein n=1 Tax=Jimgerdemannia flammicorona TaxID=994334 RepID=A0A433DI65_9FUNG|nr:WD40-repeat-containing domain protein [Jimgerdemannia flammicorona]
MSFNLFPPSPNWYAAKLCTIANQQNLFIYASRNSLFVLNATTLQYLHTFTGHKERVNSVSARASLCASASADKSVKCWDLATMTFVEGYELHRNEVLSLTWLEDKSILISGDKSGQLIAWNSETKKNRRSTFLSSAVYCLAATAVTGRDIVAVGDGGMSTISRNHLITGRRYRYQNGSIVVVEMSIEKESVVLYRLQGHDDEIHGLAWQPPPSVRRGTLDQDPAKFASLASGSRDKIIHIWDVSSETALKTLTLPKAKGHLTEQQKSRLWITVAWSLANRNQLISIRRWPLAMRLQYLRVRRRLQGHHRLYGPPSTDLVSVSMVAFCSSHDVRRLTTARPMDCQIILWDLRTRRPSLTIGTLGGFVYSLDVCDTDPRKVAMGLGDNTIKIWNYGNAENFYDSVLLWKGLKAKVTCVKWHPTQEGILAFGTDTGNVGVFDIYAEKHTTFKSYHKDKVYAIDWGPPVSARDGTGAHKEKEAATDRTWAVYSCGGDGIVLVGDPEKPAKASADIKEAVEKGNSEWVNAVRERSSKLAKRSEVAVHPRQKYVALGNADGSVEVFALPEYRLVYWFNGHKGWINRLKWCASGDGMHRRRCGSPRDPKMGWCAFMISGTPRVSFRTAFRFQRARASALSNRITKASRTWRGNRLPGGRGCYPRRLMPRQWYVSGLATLIFYPTVGSGRPYNNISITKYNYSLLTIKVWDIPQGAPIALFRGHQGRILSAVWSLLEEDLVFTGGDDLMVCVWRVGEWPYVKIAETDRKNNAKAKKPTESPSSSSVVPGQSVGEYNATVGTDQQNPPSMTAFSAVSASGPASIASLSSTAAFLTPPATTLKKAQFRVIKKGKTNILPLSTASFLTEPRKKLQRQCLELAAKLYGGDVKSALEEMERAVGEGEERAKLEMGAEAEGGGTKAGTGEDEDGDGGEKDTEGLGDVTGRSVSDLIFGEKADVRKLVEMEAIIPSRGNPNTNGHCGMYFTYTISAENHTRTIPSAISTASMAYNFALPLDVWRSNLSDVIAQAMEDDEVGLQEWITVALSPSAGRDVWVALLRRQAEKLAASGDHHTAAMCFLACSEVYEAVGVYSKAGMYREAIALVKLRLPPEDPILAELCTEWALQCESKGLYEQAAKCYLAAQTPTSIQHALNALARRNDPSALYATACLAKVVMDASADERVARYESEMRRRKEWEEGMNEHIRALTDEAGNGGSNEIVEVNVDEVAKRDMLNEGGNEAGGRMKIDDVSDDVQMHDIVGQVSGTKDQDGDCGILDTDGLGSNA